MKKFFWIFLLLMTTVTIIYFIPVAKENDIIIKNNFDNTLSSLNTFNNWKRWHPLVKSPSSDNAQSFQFVRDSSKHLYKFLSNDDSLIIETPNPLLYIVRQYSKAKFASYSYAILPSLNSTNFITVRVTEKTPLLFYIFPFLYRSQGENGALALKRFLENTRDVYGYDIKIENVTDTVFAIEMLTISTTELFKILPTEFANIDAFVKKQGLIKTNFNSVSYVSKDDSLQLIFGMPVNKFAAGKEKIRCVNIPKGKMLTAMYEGKFNERKKIYQAFEKYTKDHLLENVGASFESYINNQFPVSDSSFVKFKFYYPIL